MTPPRRYCRLACKKKASVSEQWEHRGVRQAAQPVMTGSTYGTYLTPESSKLLMMYSGSLNGQPNPRQKAHSKTHCSCHLGRICPGNVVVQPLPPRNPAASRVTDRDQTLEDLRGAFLNSIVIPAELEDVFAVRTAVTHEFLEQATGQRSAVDP